MLEYKADWQEAKQRLAAWWDGELLDRAVVQVTAPRDGVVVRSDWEVWWPSHFLAPPREVAARFEGYCHQTFFGGEAFPNLWINLGPGIMATYIGAVPRFMEETTWFETPKEWDELEAVEYDAGNAWWQRTRALTETALTCGRGKYITGTTDLGGTLDVAASLRGTQRLLTDLLDTPERVEQLIARVNQLWFRYYTELYELVRSVQEGTSGWMGIWSPGRWYPLQCDFAAMISPRMFEAFVLPHLTEQCDWLDHAVYHWDGPGQLVHLDLLLGIDSLRAIQWVPGAGSEPEGWPGWYPYYRRILDAGKNLIISVEPQDVEPLIREFGPRGLLLQTSCATEGKARRLLERVASLGRG